MTESTEPSVEARIAERRRLADEQRARLAGINFDGPHEFHGSDMFSAIGAFGGSGGGTLKYAICLACGAMVRLDDPQPSPADASKQIERGIYLHRQWHES